MSICKNNHNERFNLIKACLLLTWHGFILQETYQRGAHWPSLAYGQSDNVMQITNNTRVMIMNTCTVEPWIIGSLDKDEQKFLQINDTNTELFKNICYFILIQFGVMEFFFQTSLPITASFGFSRPKSDHSPGKIILIENNHSKVVTQKSFDSEIKTSALEL